MGIRARWGVVLGALAAGCVTWGQPTLTVAPQALTFCVEVNNIPKGREAAALAIASNEKTSFTATASQPWIKLGAATGVTNFLDPVSVDLTGFSSNTYGGIVTVTVGSLITTVPVTALVTDTPTACLDNGPWEVWYERGSNVYPSPFVFHVYSTDGSAVPYSVQISPGSAGDFLSTFPQTGTTPGDVLFSLNTDVVSKIPDGTYPITVSLITAGAGKSPDVKVTLHVTDSPVIYTFPPVFTYPYQIGQPLTVQTLDASIDDGSAQTTAVQGLGCITGGPLTGTTPFEIRYGPTAPLPTQEGSCPSGLVLTSPAAANSPQISLGNVLTSTKPLLRSGVSHFRFQAPHGFNPPGQTFDVQSTDTKTPINFTLTTNLPGGETWLSIGSASGTTTQTIQVNVNADGLSPGSYFGGITALDTSPSGSKVPLTIPVSLLVAAQATVSPNSLTFITNFKEAAPSPQTLTVTASGLGLEYILKASTTSGGNWLLLENGTGTTPGSITVSANPAGLGPGSYSGALSVAVGQAANSPLIVPVSLDDIGESGMTVNPASLTFTYSQGSNESPSTDLTVSSTGPAIDVNASAICHGCDNLIKVSPTSATTPATVTV